MTKWKNTELSDDFSAAYILKTSLWKVGLISKNKNDNVDRNARRKKMVKLFYIKYN